MVQLEIEGEHCKYCVRFSEQNTRWAPWRNGTRAITVADFDRAV